MTEKRPRLVHPERAPSGDCELPHEGLDVYRVLDEAYKTVVAWQGVSWSRGTTGDQLKRALSGALLRYTEGYYAEGGNKAALWRSSRASCGEAAAAIRLLALDRVVSGSEAKAVRGLLARVSAIGVCFG